MTTVAACQMRVECGDVEKNLERIRDLTKSLPERVSLAVFPETALTGGPAPDRRVPSAEETEALAIRIDDDRLDAIENIAAEADCMVVVGLLERTDDTCYNTTAVIDADGIRSRYRKRHLWNEETEPLSAGSDRIVVDTPLGETGVMTCYDLNFVEESAAITRSAVVGLLVPGAWPATHDHNWSLLIRARALDGVRWCVAANRTGPEYAGGSAVVRPDGQIAAAIGRETGVAVAECDPAVLNRQRECVGIFDD